jgi:hypothetical protein
MVWSQYVYEATAGYDVIPSDEDEVDDELHLSIEDWQIKYSGELWALWDLIQGLLKDAYLERSLLTECDFSDFAEFCYNEQYDDCDYVWIPYEHHLSYIWRHVQDYIDDVGMSTEIMVGATFDHWVQFVAEHTCKKYVTVY